MQVFQMCCARMLSCLCIHVKEGLGEIGVQCLPLSHSTLVFSRNFSHQLAALCSPGYSRYLPISTSLVLGLKQVQLLHDAGDLNSGPCLAQPAFDN